VGEFSLSRRWIIEGWDTFAGEPYHVGRYFTESGARRRARRYLRKLEAMQPAETSGGQSPDGIQDRVFIVRPDGTRYRFQGL